MMKSRRSLIAPLVASAASLLWGCADDRPSTSPRRTALVQYQSCSELEADLKSQLIAHADALLDSTYGNNWFPQPEADPSSPPSGGNDASGDARVEGSDYSGTNNQEDGVDEGDFVKTDGYHIYTLVTDAHAPGLRIMGVPQFGELVDEATLPIEGYPSQLLINGDTAAVFSSVYTYDLEAGNPLRDLAGTTDDDGNWAPTYYALTKVTIVDVSNRNAPVVTDEFYLDGDLQMSRRIDDAVRLATFSTLNAYPIWNLWNYYYENGEDIAATRAAVHAAIIAMPLASLVPSRYTKDGETYARAPITESVFPQLSNPANSAGYGVSSIYSFELTSPEAIDQDHIVSNYGTFYASKDTLVLADFAFDWWYFYENGEQQDTLNIHAFDLSTPGHTNYLGSGRVDGYLINQFSLDEHEGKIRVATSTGVFGRWWQQEPTTPESHITVLALQDNELVTVGHLGGIAPGEQIFSARFLDERAYLVTFEQTDPLFTIDMSNPFLPTIAGELEIPGVSTYLHPISDDALLSIGVGGDEAGADWWNTTVSLFNVSDFSNPVRTDLQSLALDPSWYGYSEAQWDHKAFQYFAPKKLLSVPLEGAKYSEGPDNDNDGYADYYTYEYISELVLLNVDEQAGLSIKGTIDHSPYYATSPCYWSPGVRRTIFMGDYIYGISGRVITVSRTSDLQLMTSQELAPQPEYDESGYCYGGGGMGGDDGGGGGDEPLPL